MTKYPSLNKDNQLLEPCTSYEIDWDSNKSLKNWVEPLDLMCRSKGEIGFLGSTSMIGWSIALVFFPRLSDLKGRKNILVGMLSLQIVCLIFLLKPFNFMVTAIVCILYGMTGVSRWTIGYIYLAELVPP